MALVPFATSGNSLDLVGWTQVNSKQITFHRRLVQEDDNISKGYSRLSEALLAGNILFRSKGEGNTSRFDKNDRAAKWRSKVYSECSQDCILGYYTPGFVFVSTTEDESGFGKKPVVLDFESLDIFMKKNYKKEIIWRIFERPDSMFSVGGSGVMTEWGLPSLTPSNGRFQTAAPHLERREIFDFKAYVFWPPTADGNLTCPLNGVAADIMIEYGLLLEARRAQALRSNPPLVTQRETAKADDSRLTLGNPMDSAISSSRADHSLYLGDGMSEGPMRGSQAMAYNGLGVPCEETAESKTSNRTETRTTWINEQPVKEVFLDADRQYVKHTVPESAWTDYLTFRQARKESVLELFGIPAAMIHQKSAMGQANSMNENVMQIYLNAQKRMKQILIPILSDIYQLTTLDTHAADYIVDAYKQKTGEQKEEDAQKDPDKQHKSVVGSKDFKAAMDVEITLPGLPDQLLIEKLYTLGMLKYESFISYMNAKWDIPIESFETAQPENQVQLHLQEQEEKKLMAGKAS